ncbi:MAG: hypothetical protein NC123_04045 [Butyrivibrio sp.]|nr:hypothetical protein [Butyrivibrio sp.]
MNFKEEYGRYNEKIRPEESLVEQMKEEAGQRQEERRPKAFRVMQSAAAVAAACLCIFVGIPTLAANIDPIYNIMYRFSPKLAQEFRLVQTRDEDQGIRMELEAVYVEGNELQAYISLQDLEGDRIDETTDLFNSYSINTPVAGYAGGGYKPVEYDRETGKATFLITVGQLGRDIQGEKITFSLREILGKKKEYTNLPIPIPWSDIQENPETMELWISSSGGPSDGNKDAVPNMWGRPLYDEEGNFIENTPSRYTNMLKPKEPDPRFPVEGIAFTGMGYIDGILHIQTAVYDNLHNDNHCELFLMDEEGNLRLYDYKISGSGESDANGKQTGYQDCLFAVTPEELEHYTLCGDFTVSGVYMTGYWSITFPLEQEED